MIATDKFTLTVFDFDKLIAVQDERESAGIGMRCHDIGVAKETEPYDLARERR